MGCGGATHRGEVVRPGTHRPRGRPTGLVVARLQEARVGDGRVHLEGERIERTQPERRLQVIHRFVRAADEQLQPAADVPREREPRIEGARLLDQRDAAIDVVDDVCQCMRGSGERDGVVLPGLHAERRQLLARRDIGVAIGHPPVRLALDVAVGRHRAGRREAGIAIQGSVQQHERVAHALLGPLERPAHAAHVELVGVRLLERLAADPLDLGLLELRDQ